MHIITRHFPIEAAHRLLGHRGKCRNIHGHSYLFSVTLFRADDEALDSNGMVVDFDELDSTIGEALMRKFDHALILEANDPLVGVMDEYAAKSNVTPHYKARNGDGQKVARLVLPPTAEVLATEFYVMCVEALKPSLLPLVVVSTTCRETVSPLCEATYIPPTIANGKA